MLTQGPLLLTRSGLVGQGRIPETTLQCVQHLRRHIPQAKISIEVEKPGRDGLEELAAEADVVFYSRSWAEVRASLPSSKQSAGPGAQHHRFQ